MTFRVGRTGKRRERIAIRKVTTTQDDAGQPVVTYSNRYASVPAAFEDTGGTETLRGKQIEAGIGAVFNIGYLQGIEETDRIVFNGRNYGIVNIRRVEGGLRMLELFCRALDQ